MTSPEEIKRTLTLEQHRAQMRQDTHAYFIPGEFFDTGTWVYGEEAAKLREQQRSKANEGPKR